MEREMSGTPQVRTSLRLGRGAVGRAQRASRLTSDYTESVFVLPQGIVWILSNLPPELQLQNSSV